MPEVESGGYRDTGEESRRETPAIVRLGEEIASYRNDVYRICRRRVNGEINPDEVASDLAQQAMAAAIRNAATYRGEGKLKAWLALITLNLINGYFQKKRRDALARAESLTPTESERRSFVHSLPDPSTGENMAVNNLDRRRRQEELDAAIKRLPDSWRDAFVLFLEGHSAKKIAESLGISPIAVRIRLHHAKQQVGRELGVELTKSIEKRREKPLAA